MLVFDRIVIHDGDAKPFTVEEFLALPLHRRVQYLLSRRVEFYLKDTVVSSREALNSLRELTTQAVQE